MADGVLLPLLHAGDHAAHGALFDRYGQLVYGFCARRCGDRGRAEDMLSIVFLEVLKSDSSDFEEDLVVRGVVVHGFRVLKVRSGNVPNTIATILLQIRNITGRTT